MALLSLALPDFSLVVIPSQIPTFYYIFLSCQSTYADRQEQGSEGICTKSQLSAMMFAEGIQVSRSTDKAETFHWCAARFSLPCTLARSSKKITLREKISFWRTRRKTSLFGGCVITASTLILNVCATIYLRQHVVPDPGTSETTNPRLFLGSCTTAARLNTGLHVAINALSTLLLSASNMFMQLLLAPTRAEVNAMHRRQRWADIGTYNLRNLRCVGARNRILWFLLALSSAPLHLM